MMHIKRNSDNNDILTRLDEMITSFSVKSDYYELESEFFSLISNLIPAHATAIYLFKSSANTPVYISGQGVDKDFLSYYEKQGREVDPLRSWIMAKRSPNQSQRLLGLKGWRHHPVYNVVKTASIDFAMQAPIINASQIMGTINFGRELDEGPFKKHDLQAISILSHFLGLAIINSLGNNSIAEYNRKFYESIDNMKQGMLIASRDYTINYANQEAKRVILRYFGEVDSENEISNLIRSSENNQKTSENKILSLRSCPMPGSNRKQKIVFIDENPRPSIGKLVQEILSTREIDVLLLVDRGLQNKAISEKLDISVNTVKRHLDNIYGKFNVNSRTKLISKFYYLNSIS